MSEEVKVMNIFRRLLANKYETDQDHQNDVLDLYSMKFDKPLNLENGYEQKEHKEHALEQR